MIYDIIISTSESDTDKVKLTTIDGRDLPVVFFGKGTYTGNLRAHSMVHKSIEEDVHFFQIGRYTSIGTDNNYVFNMNHDFDAVFQGVISEFSDIQPPTTFRKSMGQSERTLKQKGSIIIGNDVWIGLNVTILSGVVIGNGAIIGAGSVITKDVPAYAVVAGNPARIIRYRFPEEIIKGLQKICWWNFTQEELLAAKEDMLGDVESFVKKYEPLAKVCDFKGTLLPTISHRSVPIMLLFPDFFCDYPSYGRVLEQFAAEFSDSSAELVLVYHNNPQEKNAIEAISKPLSLIPDSVLISLVCIDEEDEEAVISEADFLFMSRDVRNIIRTSYAFKYGVKCLSSVDKPIFTSRIKEQIYNTKHD